MNGPVVLLLPLEEAIPVFLPLEEAIPVFLPLEEAIPVFLLLEEAIPVFLLLGRNCLLSKVKEGQLIRRNDQEMELTGRVTVPLYLLPTHRKYSGLNKIARAMNEMFKCGSSKLKITKLR
jgi:hypothetical protein